jgi:multiple sugar transport system permease protein
MQPIGEVKTNLLISKKYSRNKRNLFYGLLFSGPAILGFFIFTFVPLLAVIVLSLTDYKLFNSKLSFVGIDNYIRMFTGKDPYFYKSAKATLLYVIIGTPSFIIFSFSLAMLLNQKIKGLALFRAIFYLPYIVPAVATSMIWMWMFNPDLGILNNILSSVGIPKSLWIYDEATVIPSVVLVVLWTTGNYMLIFLAGLKAIPEHYYEAIEIDGGNSWHKFIYITIPMVTPAIFFNTIMGFITTFQVFNEAYILTQGGGPNNASLFFVFNIWRQSFKYQEMGYACALSLLLFLFILLFTLIIFRFSKWVYYEGDDKDK